MKPLILIFATLMLVLAACGNSSTPPAPTNPSTPDTTAPTLTSSQPANSATEVAVSTNLQLGFSEAMNPSSLSVTVEPSVDLGSATWLTGNNNATFNPPTDLAADTTYTVTVAAKDVAGNNLGGSSSFSFITAAASNPNPNPTPDTTAPTIQSSQPANNATAVATNANIQIRFSEAMNRDTVAVSSSPSFDLGTASWNSESTIVSFDPAAELAADTAYTLSVSGRDAAGNDLSGDTDFSFRTAAAPDTTAPTIVSSEPANNATGVAINTGLLVNFSEAMNPSSVTVSISPSVNLGAAVWVSENRSVRFDPPADLAGDSTYSVTVSGRDAAGNNLTGSTSFGFRTAVLRDTTAPAIPTNLRATVSTSRDGEILLEWNTNSEGDLRGYTLYYGSDAGNLDNTAFISRPGTSRNVTGLTPGTRYYFALAAEDNAGNRSGRTSNVSATARDITAPRLVSSTPSDRAQNVQPGTQVVFNFSEPMNRDRSEPIVNCYTKGGLDSVCGTVQSRVWSNNDTRLTLTFTTPRGLGNKVTRQFVLPTGQDKAGNTLPAFEMRFEVADLVRPYIVSITPTNNSVGLPNNAPIRITFSESMNRARVSSNEVLTTTAGSFARATSWLEFDTVYLIQPTSLFAYGSSVTVGVGTGATDAAGNALTPSSNIVFRVINQQTVVLPSFGSGHILRRLNVTRGLVDLNTVYLNESVNRVGDRDPTTISNGQAVVEYSRVYLSFLINAIPRSATIVSARLVVPHVRTTGNPFGNLGGMFVERVNPSQIIENGYTLRTTDFDVPALACTGCPLTIGGVNIDADVTGFVNSDRANSHALAQMRLRFSRDYSSDNNDYLDYSKNPTLTVTYQYP